MGILDNAKVADLVKKYNNLNLYQKILDLRDQIFQLREENLALQTRVQELEDAEDVSSRLRRVGNVYRLFRLAPKSLIHHISCTNPNLKRRESRDE